MSEVEITKIISKFDKISTGKKSMDEVPILLDNLEKMDLTKEILGKTRLGLILNEFRKKIEDEKLAKRAKYLIKKWKTIMESKDNNSTSSTTTSNNTPTQAGKISRSDNGSRKTSSVSTPPPDEPKKPKMENLPQPSVPQLEKKPKEPEKPSTSVNLPPRDTSLRGPHDDSRVRSVTVLANSLKSGAFPDGTKNPDDLAILIEDAIFMAHSGDKYAAAIRSRVFNLRDKRNQELRENVLVGSITPERFAVMTAEEMASSEMKKMREQFTKEAINEHQMAVTEGTPSDMFKCGKCGKNNCTYNQMQTRSADEPMTTFVYCRECGNRWKFC